MDLLDTEKYVEFGTYHLNLYRNSPAFRKPTNVLVDWLSLHVKDRSVKILDIGAGEGLYIKLLYERGYKNISGIDLNKIAVGYAKEHDIPVDYANVYNFDKPADIGLLIHAFEHFDKPSVAVENITKNIQKELYIVNPLWGSQHHFDNYNIETIASQFKDNWFVDGYKHQHNTEFIRLVRKQRKNTIHNEGLLRYEGIHGGKRALIFSPGPSIRKYRRLTDENSFIKMGVKQAVEFRSDYNYYFFGDKNERSQKYEGLIGGVSGTRFCLCEINGCNKVQLYNEREAASFNAVQVSLTGFLDGEYSIDIARDSYKQCTTTHAAINFAIFCGIYDIWLVGCDSTMAKSLYEENDKASQHHHNMWLAFDKHFDFPALQYTFVNPVKIFTKTKYNKLCQ